MPVCDGCGAPVDDAHIRRRIERLELATRFRPVHISVLLIDAAPPDRAEDYFYRATTDSAADRSPVSRAYFDALVRCAGVTPDRAMNEEAALAEFQRRGLFLIGAIECAVENATEAQRTIARTAPALLRRVNVSYKPKSIALLSSPTAALVPVFQENGWGDRLILDDGKPFAPVPGDTLAKAIG